MDSPDQRPDRRDHPHHPSTQQRSYNTLPHWGIQIKQKLMQAVRRLVKRLFGASQEHPQSRSRPNPLPHAGSAGCDKPSSCRITSSNVSDWTADQHSVTKLDTLSGMNTEQAAGTPPKTAFDSTADEARNAPHANAFDATSGIDTERAADCLPGAVPDGATDEVGALSASTQLEIEQPAASLLTAELEELSQHQLPTGGALFDDVARPLPVDAPPALRDPSLRNKAISVFEGSDRLRDGRYRLRRKRRTHAQTPVATARWLGKPGTELFAWEEKLRNQLERVAWVGQIALSVEEFDKLCAAIQAEARAPHYFTKAMCGQPRLVPAAVFVTTMVFAARYSQQDADEFWVPYLRTVWNVDYTQAFMARCRHRFASAVAELEQVSNLAFPRVSGGDLVAPVYRHALLPRYVQDDFARWMRSKWRNILPLADAPALLIPELQQDSSLTNLPQRLRAFILSKNSRETAADLIADMAGAISLHINQGESIDNIAKRLAATPIKQELWAEIAQEFAQSDGRVTTSLSMSKPRVQWIWDLQAGELVLRVQNLVVGAAGGWEGEPHRLVWVESLHDDPNQAEIQVEVTPWRMQSGERVIQEVILAQPNGPLDGQLVLLTDMDEPVQTLPIPPRPSDLVQFFRLTQQNAFGLPVENDEVGSGTWLVCTNGPVRFYNADDELLEPDRSLPVPYPLDAAYRWAAQVTLTLPATVHMDGTEDIDAYSDEPLRLEGRRASNTAALPVLGGDMPVAGLVAQFQATYASTAVTLTFEEDGARIAKQTTLWIQGQDGWRWYRSMMTLIEDGQAMLDGDTLTVHLGRVLPRQAGAYTLDVRASLQSLLPMPLSFAVVPELHVELPAPQPLYSPAHPFEVILRGLIESDIVPRLDVKVTTQKDGSLRVLWSDLRNDPRLLLRFSKTEIPLGWSPPRAMAWLEPVPRGRFLTLDELRDTTLHVVTKGISERECALSLSEGGTRRYALHHGCATVAVAQDQLHAMVRMARQPHLSINVHIGSATWTLCDIRPTLSQVRVVYDEISARIQLDTDLRQEWPGDFCFLAESRSNPFAPLVELGRRDHLSAQHTLSSSLSPGNYRLVIQLDGAALELNEQATRFDVGGQVETQARSDALIGEIRSGQLISGELAEDFVLSWAELAEKGETHLTPSTLYQLAAMPARALENFQPNHLESLWPVLAAVRNVQDEDAWLHAHGLLPAWILLPNPLVFCTLQHRFEWPVYPLVAARRGLAGKGYGIWSISGSSVQVYVEWRSVSATHVHVEAGIPGEPPLRWEEMELVDTSSLYYCAHCGRLVGQKGVPYPSDETRQMHRHGHAEDNLRDINVAEEHGGHRLIVGCFDGRGGRSLLRIYDEYEVCYPTAESYLPEPPLLQAPPSLPATVQRAFGALAAGVVRYGDSSEEASPWAGAARLLMFSGETKSVSDLGQAALALGVLLRTAAYHPHRYQRLLQRSALTPATVQNLLAELNQSAAAHLHWGMTWAELLMLHSPGFATR